MGAEGRLQGLAGEGAGVLVGEAPIAAIAGASSVPVHTHTHTQRHKRQVSPRHSGMRDKCRPAAAAIRPVDQCQRTSVSPFVRGRQEGTVCMACIIVLS